MDPFTIATTAGHPLVTPQPHTSASLRDWERLMHRGRHAQLAGQQTSALHITAEALALAETLLEDRAGAPDDCVAALVVSHHNMAFLRQQTGDALTAATHLCHAHSRLMGLLRDASAPAPLQQAAWRHSRETHAALLHFLREPGHPVNASAVTLVLQTLSTHANLAQHCGAAAH